jgi:hypothetical protein
VAPGRESRAVADATTKPKPAMKATAEAANAFLPHILLIWIPPKGNLDAFRAATRRVPLYK